MPTEKLIMETRENGGILSVRVSGALNLQSLGEFRTNLHSWDETRTHQVLLDLNGLKFMDSSGLGALVQGIQTCRERSIDLKLLNVPKPFQAVMHEIGLGGFL